MKELHVEWFRVVKVSYEFFKMKTVTMCSLAAAFVLQRVYDASPVVLTPPEILKPQEGFL